MRQSLPFTACEVGVPDTFGFADFKGAAADLRVRAGSGTGAEGFNV